MLRSHGHETAHWWEVGDPKAPDSLIMRYAVEMGYVVLTCDLDFSAILAANRGSAPSVVQLRAQDVLPVAIGERVCAVLERYQKELRAGALISIDEWHSRVRVLPL